MRVGKRWDLASDSDRWRPVTAAGSSGPGRRRDLASVAGLTPKTRSMTLKSMASKSITSRNSNAAVLLASLVLVFTTTGRLLGQAEDIWEYSPYRVQVWVALGDSAALTERLEQQVIRRVKWQAEIVDQSAWRVEATRAPEVWRQPILSQLSEMGYPN